MALLLASLYAAPWPTAAQVFTTYYCRDGSEFVVAFYEGDKRAYLQLDGKALTLARRLSVRGRRYAKGGVTLLFAKTGTTLKRGKHMTECTAD